MVAALCLTRAGEGEDTTPHRYLWARTPQQQFKALSDHPRGCMPLHLLLLMATLGLLVTNVALDHRHGLAWTTLGLWLAMLATALSKLRLFPGLGAGSRCEALRDTGVGVPLVAPAQGRGDGGGDEGPVRGTLAQLHLFSLAEAVFQCAAAVVCLADVVQLHHSANGHCPV
jgi:hypothetical protein